MGSWVIAFKEKTLNVEALGYRKLQKHSTQSTFIQHMPSLLLIPCIRMVYLLQLMHQYSYIIIS